MDGHGWSNGGEKNALAFSAMHPVFPGQHLSAPFQDLTDSTKPPPKAIVLVLEWGEKA